MWRRAAAFDGGFSLLIVRWLTQITGEILQHKTVFSERVSQQVLCDLFSGTTSQ